MEDYKSLLEKAYKEVKLVETNGERFEIPKVKGHVSGKNTIITNIGEISDYIRREKTELAKFLQKELAAPVKLQGDRLTIISKLNSNKVNDKITLYVKEFVRCPVCNKPDTETISEKGIKYKHCLACGAKSPIKYHL